MIRNFLLRVLAALAHFISRAQAALAEKKAEITHLATTVEVEILRSGVAIADNVDAKIGAVHRLDRELADRLVAMEVARRV